MFIKMTSYRAISSSLSNYLVLSIGFPVEELHVTWKVSKASKAKEASKRIPPDCVVRACAQLIDWFAF